MLCLSGFELYSRWVLVICWISVGSSLFFFSRVPYLPRQLLSFPMGLSNTLHCTVSGRGISGLLRSGFHLYASSPQWLEYVLLVHRSLSFPLFHYVAALREWENSISVYTRTVLSLHIQVTSLGLLTGKVNVFTAGEILNHFPPWDRQFSVIQRWIWALAGSSKNFFLSRSQLYSN